MSRVWDKEKLLEQLDGDLEFLKETADDFARDLPGHLVQIRNAVDAGDRAALRDSAHTLKGVLLVIHARGASEAAQQLVELAESGSLASAAVAMRALDSEIQALREALRES